MQKNCGLVIFLLFALSIPASAQRPTYTVDGDTLIHLSGYQITLTPQGFPQQIVRESAVGVKDTAASSSLLAENIHFHLVRQSDGKDIRLKASGVSFTNKGPGKLEWQASAAAPEIGIDVVGTLGSNWLLTYKVKVTAMEDLDLKEIVLHIPFEKAAALYATGLGLKMGFHPDTLYHWKWEATSGDGASAWVGTTLTGLRFTLLQRSSWDNAGKGGVDIGYKGKSMLASSYSGTRHLSKGDSLYYNFDLELRALVTQRAPVHSF